MLLTEKKREKKPKKDKICGGRNPETGRKCERTVYQSDGEFLYLGDTVFNPGAIEQTVTCLNCGTSHHWRRGEKFIGSKHRNFKRNNRTMRYPNEPKKR